MMLMLWDFLNSFFLVIIVPLFKIPMEMYLIRLVDPLFFGVICFSFTLCALLFNCIMLSDEHVNDSAIVRKCYVSLLLA